MERKLYAICKRYHITYVTISHRPALMAYHDTSLAIGDGAAAAEAEAAAVRMACFCDFQKDRPIIDVPPCVLFAFALAFHPLSIVDYLRQFFVQRQAGLQVEQHRPTCTPGDSACGGESLGSRQVN